MNEEIEHLGQQVYALEEDADRVSEEHEHLREEAAEREALETLASALNDVRPFPISPSLPFSHVTKPKISSLKSQLQDLQENYDQSL